MESDPVLAAIAELRAAYDTVAACSIQSPTPPELLTALAELEALTRQLPAQSHRILARLHREASPVALGAKSWRDVLTGRLRISGTEAKRRLAEAEDLGPRTGLCGETQEPLYPRIAAAQAAGTIGGEHVRILRTFFLTLPRWVDGPTREQCEATLVEIAVGFGPEELSKAAALLKLYLDQDGPEPDDAERARRRTLDIKPQQSDGMSEVTGQVDPQFLATFEPILAKLAAPGMCNPADEHPCICGTPSQAQIDADTRSHGQRVHDAMIAVGRHYLTSGDLGRHNGLPATIIVSTTLQDLESAAGSAVTAGGSRLPMSDVIRLAAHAHHYLVVFDKHTNEVLHCGRSKRIAPAAHRIVLLSRDGGCTKPGCSVPGYGTQVHHVNGWATNGGQTNVDEEVLACGPDNRLAETGWTVTLVNGVAEWIPPPHLDTGQPRINYHHHPHRLLNGP